MMGGPHVVLTTNKVIWDLPAADFKMYAALLRHVDGDYKTDVSNKVLAATLGLSERSVSQQIANLEKQSILGFEVLPAPQGRGNKRYIQIKEF